jgi:hypothetical protein
MKLYELTDQYQSLIDLAESSEGEDQQAFTDTIEALAGEIDEKVINGAAVVKTLEANALAVAAEAERLDKRRKTLAAVATHLKNYMQRCMESAGIPQVKNDLFTVSVQTNPASVAIKNEDEIPPEFMRVKREPDRATIARTLKDGGAVPGCELVQTKSLRIR